MGIKNVSESSKETRKAPVPVKVFFSLAAVAFIFAMLFFSNRFYYFFTAEENLVSLDVPTVVERPGLFWGSYLLRTIKIISNRDTVSAIGPGSLELKFNARVAYQSHSRFQIQKQDQQGDVKIVRGQFALVFREAPGIDRSILLPGGAKIKITGTTVLLDVIENSNFIYLSEGSAKLLYQNRNMSLEQGSAYLVSDHSVRKLPPAESLSQIHRLAANLSQYLAITREKVVPGKTNVSLKQLAQKYGRLTAVHLKNGRVLVGLYKDQGAFSIVTTTHGEEKIASDQIDLLKPYKVND